MPADTRRADPTEAHDAKTLPDQINWFHANRPEGVKCLKDIPDEYLLRAVMTALYVGATFQIPARKIDAPGEVEDIAYAVTTHFAQNNDLYAAARHALSGRILYAWSICEFDEPHIRAQAEAEMTLVALLEFAFDEQKAPLA